MTSNDVAKVNAIYRYPVKGLTPERMPRVSLAADQTLPFDRVYAIENGRGRFDPGNPQHLPKVNFLMLMRNARMARLQTKFDTESHQLTIARNGQTVVKGALNTSAGRAIIGQFLSAYMADDLRGAPHVVAAAGHSFSDVKEKCVHIVNLASLRELERLAGQHLNPIRFRPNLVLASETPWQEFDWLGKTLAIGNAEVTVFKRTERCAAVNVNPETGERDMDLPVHLARNWGHTDFGVYAQVTKAGDVASDAPVSLCTSQT